MSPCRHPRPHAARRALFSVVLLCTVAGARADWLPQQLRADYAMQALGMAVGHTRWQLSRPAADRILFESVSEPSGLYALLRGDVARESSEMRVLGDGLRPLHYHFVRSGGKRQREVTVDFDWSAGTAEVQAKGERLSMPLPPGTLDKLGYLLLVMRDLASGQRELSYVVAAGAELETYRLHSDGAEQVDTPLGRFSALRVRRLDQAHRQTTIWFAPALSFLPIRIDHTERDDSTVRLLITAVDGISRR